MGRELDRDVREILGVAGCVLCAVVGACSGDGGDSNDPSRTGDASADRYGGGSAIDASRPTSSLDAAVADGAAVTDARIDISLALVGSGEEAAAAFSPRWLPSSAAFRPAGVTTAALLGDFQNVYAVGSGLESLKLFIKVIQICEHIGLDGTAYTGLDGCLVLYRGPDPGDLEDGKDLETQITAALASDEGYIDVMDPSSRDDLSRSVALTPLDARSYQYGMIAWATPVKVKATLVDPSDGVSPVLYTKPSMPGTCAVNDNEPYDCAVTSDPLTEAPADEAVFAAHADVIFKFQKPLTVSAEDIEAGERFSLALAFNPHGLVQGVMSPGATNYPPLTDNLIGDGYNVGNSISLVGAQLAPVIYGSGQQVLRESYLATLPAANGGSFDLRVELYTLEDDPTIYGVSTATLPNADTAGYLVGYHSIYGIETANDGSIALLDYQDQAQISDFARVTSEGATTTAKVLCEPVVMDCTAGTTLDATFRLDALEPVDAASYPDPDR